jgi:hypothetical protein
MSLIYKTLNLTNEKADEKGMKSMTNSALNSNMNTSAANSNNNSTSNNNKFNNNNNNNNSTTLTFSTNLLNDSSNGISAAKKSAALSNITATIAKQLQQLNQQAVANSSPNKLISNPNSINLIASSSNNALANGGANKLTFSLDANNNNNGVACSLVKSNINIHYNQKVESNANRAIHYCNKCTNSECKAIHKSLSEFGKPFVAHASSNDMANTNKTVQLNPVANLNKSNLVTLSNENSNAMSNQMMMNNPQLTRIFVGPQIQQHQQIKLHPLNPATLAATVNQNSTSSSSISPGSLSSTSSSSLGNAGSTQQANTASANSKQLGANINFIFERRYPLVQLNSNLLNDVTNQANGSSDPQSLHQPRHIVISRAGHHHHHNLNQINNYLNKTGVSNQTNNGNESTTSQSQPQSHQTLSFPLPLSPSSLHAVAAAAALAAAHSSSFIANSNNNNVPNGKSPTFSINFNRLPVNNSNNNNNNNNNSTLSKDVVDDLNNPNNLRYRNILFLDQVRRVSR